MGVNHSQRRFGILRGSANNKLSPFLSSKQANIPFILYNNTKHMREREREWMGPEIDLELRERGNPIPHRSIFPPSSIKQERPEGKKKEKELPD